MTARGRKGGVAPARAGAILFAAAFALGAAGCGQVPVPASPTVFELAPTSARPGATVRIDGQGFGDLEGDGFVSIHGARAKATAWSDTRISVTVPAVPAGDTVLVVSRVGRTSAPVDLTVLPGS